MPTLLKFFVSLHWTSGNPCTGVLLSRYEKFIFPARKVKFQARKVIGRSRDIYNNVKRHQEMATRKIKFPVVLRQNDNSYSQAYGRYYPEAVPGETLSLSGLLAMVAFDQSVYTEDIVKGVVQAVTRSMVELLKEGQPVKWDGLGTFTPTVENTKGGATEAEIVNGTKNVNTTIAGVHIRFIPENTDGQKLTSRVFGDRCLFDLRGVLVPTVIGAGKNQKKVFNTVSLETWRGNANG